LDKVPWQLSPAFNFSPADYLLDVLWSYLIQLDSNINHPGFSPALFMISELSHSKTTSFSHIYCFFPFYVPKLKNSHLENPSKTENQITYENPMTTENQLPTCVTTRVVHIFLVICPTE